MSDARVFRGAIEDGQLCYTWTTRASSPSPLKLLSGPVVLTLRKFREQRSSSQNRYLHGVVIPILADHLGYDDHQELKHELKRKFLLDPDRIEFSPSQQDLGMPVLECEGMCGV